MESSPEARLVSDWGRNAVSLENERLRAVVGARGGMMPEFGLKRGAGLLNAHWLPEWRANSGLPWSESEHAPFWKSSLLYDIAGDFPCCPNFGDGCDVDGVSLPAHGWTANGDWRIEALGSEEGVAYARFGKEGSDARMPLAFEKTDLVFSGQDAYFSIMTISNKGPVSITVNVGRHNTLGPPFLESGCRISLAADSYLTAPKEGDFVATGRLEAGAAFSDLRRAPLAGGGSVDLSLVPGMIGRTDFVTGAVPRGLDIGWSCVSNPTQGLAYLCLFPGLPGLPEGEIALAFNDLWMQYGGRAYTPWASAEGEPDRSFCLGTENVTGAYANGLAFSRMAPELLGRETLIEIPARGRRTLCYGVALVEMDKELAADGLVGVEADGRGLVLIGARKSARFSIDASFGTARKFVKEQGGRG